METMSQQELSPRVLSVSGATDDSTMCSWLSSGQPPIVFPKILETSGCSNSARPLLSLLKKREHSGAIDEDLQPLTQKRKAYGGAASVVTPVYELSPSSTDPNIVSFNLPYFNSTGGVQNSSSPTEDTKFLFHEIPESTSSMDDEPVWDNMSDIEDDSAFATRPHPPIATRKITDDFDVDPSKEEDLPDGLFGWFTDDVVEDVKPTKSPTDVKLLNAMGDIDVDMDLDGPVFEDNILDHNLSSTSIGAAMFDFPVPNSSFPAAASLPGERQTSCASPAVHLTTLDPLPFSSPSFMDPTFQESIASVVTPARQDSNEILAMDLLANVATDVSKELLDLATDSCFDSSSDNEMMTSYQSSERKARKSGAWMEEGQEEWCMDEEV